MLAVGDEDDDGKQATSQVWVRSINNPLPPFIDQLLSTTTLAIHVASTH